MNQHTNLDSEFKELKFKIELTAGKKTKIFMNPNEWAMTLCYNQNFMRTQQFGLKIGYLYEDVRSILNVEDNKGNRIEFEVFEILDMQNP